MLLGYVSYGLSVFFYIKAQKDLGAAKTSAFYAVNPFIGAFLSMIIFWDYPSWNFYVVLSIMIIGTIFIIIDTLQQDYPHLSIYYVIHTHDGTTHTHIVINKDGHEHIKTEGAHHYHHEDLY